MARRRAVLAVLAVASLAAACTEEPPPRSFTQFMEDDLAREGALVRCNADREATAGDLECINARRAAAALAAQGEDAKQQVLDARSEARLLAARQRYDAQQAAAREAELAAVEEEQRAYEAQWVEQPVSTTQTGDLAAPPEATESSVEPQDSLEPISLPRSTLTPLTTISLPAAAKPIELEPPKPQLEEIELPDHLKR